MTPKAKTTASETGEERPWTGRVAEWSIASSWGGWKNPDWVKVRPGVLSGADEALVKFAVRNRAVKSPLSEGAQVPILVSLDREQVRLIAARLGMLAIDRSDATEEQLKVFDRDETR